MPLKNHGYLIKSMKNRLTNLGLSIVTDKLLRGEKQTTTKIKHMIRLDIKINERTNFHIYLG